MRATRPDFIKDALSHEDTLIRSLDVEENLTDDGSELSEHADSKLTYIVFRAIRHALTLLPAALARRLQTGFPTQS